MSMLCGARAIEEGTCTGCEVRVVEVIMFRCVAVCGGGDKGGDGGRRQ